MGKYSANAFGVDVSHWNGTLDWKALVGTPVKFACAKMGELSYADQLIEDTQDSQWAANVQGAYDADIPIGGYMMFNPQYYPEAFGSDISRANVSNDRQFLALKRWMTNKKLYYLVLDMERWWQSYADKNANGGTAAKTPPDWILRAVRHYLNEIEIGMTQGLIRRVPVMLYSAKWYIEGYTRMPGGASLYDITPNYPVWEALYPSTASRTVAWSDLSPILPPDTAKPTGLNGTCWIWQFSDRHYFQVGSRSVKLDANLLMRPLDEFYRLIGFSPRGATVTPPATPPETPTAQEITRSEIDALTMRIASLEETRERVRKA